MTIHPWPFEIVGVKSGANSLRCLQTGEIFHPVVGPMIEARTLHVLQQRLVQRAALTQGPFVIWDVGLGAAANAVAVLEAFASKHSTPVELHSFDETIAPLEFALAHSAELEYLAPHGAAVEALLHSDAPALSGSVRWRLHHGDFRALLESQSPLPAPHAVLYDPYSAKKNPGMWTLEHFSLLRRRLAESAPCLLTNYTRSTAVRATLLLAGFYVGHGDGVGEKDQTTIASNSLDMLTQPLDARWLSRVRASTKGAPLRAGVAEGPIGAHDWAALLAHPQFRESPPGSH